jgi:hypothetical protein
MSLSAEAAEKSRREHPELWVCPPRTREPWPVIFAALVGGAKEYAYPKLKWAGILVALAVVAYLVVAYWRVAFYVGLLAFVLYATFKPRN